MTGASPHSADDVFGVFSPLAAGHPPTSEWQSERREQESRLEEALRRSASLGARFQDIVGREQRAMERSADALPCALGQEASRLGRQFEIQRMRYEVSVQQGELGMLHGVGLETQSEVKRRNHELERTSRIQAELDKLQRRQAAAEQAATQRWVNMSLQNIGAAANHGFLAQRFHTGAAPYAEQRA